MKRLSVFLVMGCFLVGFLGTQCFAGDPPPYPGERIKDKESWVKVAAIQIEPHVGDKKYNLTKMSTFINKAADTGAKILVLPELSNSGYEFNSRAEAFSMADPVPGGETTDMLISLAKKRDVYICSGVAELDGDALYNTAVLVGPKGYIGKYRKIHLWDEECLFFEHGNLGLPIFDTPLGRVGMMICWDGWFPETYRILRIQGADIILDPTNWVYMKGYHDEEINTSGDVHKAMAHLSFVNVVSADRIGQERDVRFPGNSQIVNQWGKRLAQASLDKEEIITAEINMVSPRNAYFTHYSNFITERRIDVYDILLGYKGGSVQPN